MADELHAAWTEALGERRGKAYWRGLDELLDTPEFRQAIEREFPPGAAELAGGLSRRSFVKLLGASVALASLGGCLRRPREKILPYVDQPPELTPGLPQYYATAMTLGGYATGLLVESNAGRPTKLEGNPDHPASLGAAGVYEQASVLQLYDPHRARVASAKRGRGSWTALSRRLAPAELRRVVGTRGAGLRILLEPTASPTVGDLLARVQELYPEARIHFFAPLAGDGLHAGMAAAFGRVLQPLYDFAKADVVLALDADFLASMPFHLRYAREFASRRRTAQPGDPMNRLYVAEGVLTPTGAMADHRLRLQTSEVQQVAATVLRELFDLGIRPPGMPAAIETLIRQSGTSVQRDWARALARDLAASTGRSIVVAGDRQPAVLHLLAHLLNSALANVGRTLRYTGPALIGAGEPARGLGPLMDELRSGGVEALVILEGNPSYTAPVDAEFSRWLRTVPNSVYLGLYRNETARDCAWFVPSLHYLESWGDGRAYDGTASLVQPLIAPLYAGKTTVEMLAALLADTDRSVHDIVREVWRRRAGASDFEDFWSNALQRGVIAGTAAPPVIPGLRWNSIQKALSIPALQATEPAGLEVVFLQDPRVYDGSFANNPWLQELPEPMTKLTWDNAAMVSPATAKRLGLETEDMLELQYCSRQLRIPALVAPGQADDLLALRLGYGRGKGDEAVAQEVGFNVYPLWTSDAPYFDRGLQVGRVLDAKGEPLRHRLAITQSHWSLEGRPLVLQATLEEYRRTPEFTRAQQRRSLSLYQPHHYTGDQWAMVIDQSTCTGCSACVIACQAENNTPVVGKEGVLDSREMHWLRIDRYFTGEVDEPGVVAQPMLCQHCEKAPCEYVCPVSATVHSPDGLNEMVYNRCVGTRFCSNNCPYKVRRFNWFDYNRELSETERMVKNPDVTVRARGVMEKCTFCVQRIREAQIAASVESRSVRTDEVRTACQQACPTKAIVFGSYTNPESEVAQQRAEPRIYSVLHDLGTEPRVQYLARITNPNPTLTERTGGI